MNPDLSNIVVDVDSVVTQTMLVKLSIQSIRLSVSDKVASETVQQQLNAHRDAGYYNKKLIGKQFWRPISSIISEIREYHYSRTMPWQDKGFRIIRSDIYMDYRQQIATFRNKLSSAVDDLKSQWPAVLSDAQQRCGNMFDPTDYEDPSTLQDLFSVEIETRPVPTGDDYRIDLNDDQRKQIADETTERMKTYLSASLSEPYRRLEDCVRRIAVTLSDKDRVFHKTMLSNLSEMVSLIPALNVMDDPKLTAVAIEAKSALCAHDAKQLRKNPQLRSDVAKDAKRILNKMAALTPQVDTDQAA
jgi:hypothetical protein